MTTARIWAFDGGDRLQARVAIALLEPSVSDDEFWAWTSKLSRG